MKLSLIIDKHNLDEEVVRQAEKFRKAGDLAAIAESEEDEARAARDRAYAEADARARMKLQKTGEKFTEAMVSSRIEEDLVYQDAVKRRTAAGLKANQARVLKDAFQQRGSMLRDLVQLWIAGYYADNSARSASAARGEGAYAEDRKRMAAKRRERES